MMDLSGSRRATTALLDVDGTIIDSNDAHARAWVAAFDEAGYHVDFDVVRPMIGMGGDKLLPAAIGIEHDTEIGKRLGGRRWEIFRERELGSLRPFPCARELLERLRDDGYTLVVATSAQDEEMEELVRAAGVADLLDAATTSSDASRSKPDPDIVRAALGRAKAEPDEAVMLGDTPYDIEAAGRAGVPIVALRSGGWRPQELEGAAAVYADPCELVREYDRSLFARSNRPARSPD
jgi:HAD superfamily hydrolase (TIGR01509 family)